MPSSKLYPGEKIFDDENPIENLEVPDGLVGGCLPRDMAYGSVYGASPFPEELLIDESEWQARIEEIEERKSNISSIILQRKMKFKRQTVNFCWSETVVMCDQALRAVANMPHVELSAASVACR